MIMRVNMKSEIKPFQVFETTNRFNIFALEQRKDVSHFPWWNHWPVAQIPSDLRINGKNIPRGKDFRFGHIRRINRYDLVVWIRLESERPVTIELTPADNH